MSGALYLVSAGIGDAENITVRALNILKSADLVFAMDFLRDRFADVLAEKQVYPAGHCYFLDVPRNDALPGAEAEYRRIIRDAYAAGKTIVVLDFGDPGIFSPQRGYLNEFADLKPKIIPGISSFNAANAVLGGDVMASPARAITLTEAVEGRGDVAARLKALAQSGTGLVLFSMKMDMAAVVATLMEVYPPETSVWFVRDAGFAKSETVLRTTLKDAVAVSHKDKLGWAYLMYVACA